MKAISMVSCPPATATSSTSGLSRRTFLKRTAMASAVSASAPWIHGCASRPMEAMPAQPDLSDDQRQLFLALAPVILHRSPEESEPVVDRMGLAIDSLGDLNRGQFDELLALLTFAPTRVAIAGVWPAWEDASQKDKEEFLEDWRSSSLGLLNAGYIGLTKLTAALHYGHPENFEHSGYPGLPVAVQSLPQFQESPV